MTAWTSTELAKIDSVDEVEITSVREDGTLSSNRVIWGVRLGDKDVSFVDVEGDALRDEIDAAYRTKYRRYSSPVTAITSPAARSATLRVVPR